MLTGEWFIVCYLCRRFIGVFIFVYYCRSCFFKYQESIYNVVILFIAELCRGDVTDCQGEGGPGSTGSGVDLGEQ